MKHRTSNSYLTEPLLLTYMVMQLLTYIVIQILTYMVIYMVIQLLTYMVIQIHIHLYGLHQYYTQYRCCVNRSC